ncbi:MAG TPA: ATP-binding protein [Thermoanaerobaculia bacterium]|nr:ATP-binding protein [Thermoanaerobaculia bacterium]
MIRKRRGDPDGDDRLALVAELTTAGDAESCARATLEWLERFAGLDRGLCLLVDREARRLVPAAGQGIDPAEVEAVDLGFDERPHPLLAALVQGASGALLDDTAAGELVGERSSYRTIALAGGGDGQSALGLLLASQAADPALTAWAAEVLGMRLAALALPRLEAQLARRRRDIRWLKSVLEAVTDPVLLSDGAGRMLVANRGAEHLLSVDDSMSEGRRRAVALNNMLFSASLFTSGESGERSRREVLLVDPVDAQDLLFELLASPCDLGDGEVGTVAILRNVTDLRRATEEIEENYRKLRSAEAKTRAERDRLDLILNAVLDPIVVTDPSGNIDLMNPPGERLFTAAAGAGEPVERRLRANDAVFTSFISNLHTSQAERWRGELNLREPVSGKKVPVEAIAGRVVSPQGEATAVVTILHDLTEQREKLRLYDKIKRHSEELEARVREATAELAEQNELLRRQALELAEASRLKDQFLANVSHELRTPLNAVLGYTSLLLQGVFGQLSDHQRDRLERVESNARNLLAIINDLLDIARIEAGKMPLEIERFTVPDLIDEVMEEVEPLIERARLTVRRAVAGDVPELSADRQKVKQILINLLSNALKFTPEGSVHLRAQRRDGAVAIAVTDTGIGISEEHQKTIFEAFGQSGGSYARKQGTGLGLSICRRLATVLGGDITLESRLGEGSTFTLLLPAGGEGEG